MYKMYKKSKRKNVKNRRDPQLCYVCLSSDRTLTALGKIKKGFQQITERLDLNMVRTSLLCWECIALLKKVYWFKERAKKSQILLSQMNGSELTLPSLSNLKVVKLTTINSHVTLTVEPTLLLLEDEIKTELDDSNDPLHETEIEFNRPDYYIDADETKINEAVQNDDIKNVNIDWSDVKSECEDDFEYPEDTEQYKDLDTAESKTVIKDETLKSEQKKIKKQKLKRKQEDSDSDFELPKNSKKAIERELNINTNNHTKETSKTLRKEREGICSKNNYEMTINYRLCSNLRSLVPITREELMLMREKERNSVYFESLEKKCDLCLSKVSSSYHYGRFHRETITKKYFCDVCKTYMDDKEKMEKHIKKHYFKQQCDVCKFESLTAESMYKHMKNMHSRIIRCLTCGAEFENVLVFKEHFKEIHAKFQCGYCNKMFRWKRKLERHIFLYHITHKCKLCLKTYTDYKGYKFHMTLKHTVEKSDASYCVTCNIHFDNTIQFKQHCKNALIHQEEVGSREKVKCAESECLKLFNSKQAMMKHYRFMHLKESKFRCDICNKRYSSKCNLIEHCLLKHEGYKKEKNKICQYCGRGFSENKILINHIRTHTGERPFECSQCDAKFAQRAALMTHIKHIHLKVKRKNKSDII